MTPIAQLIRGEMDSRRMRKADVVAKGIAWSTLDNLLHREVWKQSPRPETLRKIKEAFPGLRAERIERAADASVQRSYERDAPLAEGETVSVMDAIRADPHLSDETKVHLIRQYRLLLRVQEAPSSETAALKAALQREIEEEMAAEARHSVHLVTPATDE